MSAIDNWNAPRWADFFASPMANIDDYFNLEHAELERRRTTGMDSLCGTISEELQESSPPDNSSEEESASNDATLVETNAELVASEEAPQNTAESTEPVKKKKPETKNLTTIQGRPRVLTSSVRRQSISRYRRRSDQYVPLAEALRKFQIGTPTRFRSNKSKNNDAAPLKKVKQTKSQLTYPMSPALLCKSRVRTASTASQKSEPATKPIVKSSSFPRNFPSSLQKKPTNVKPLRKIEKIPPASTSEMKVTTVPLNVPAKPKDSLRKIEKIPPASSSETKVTTVPLNVPAKPKDSLRKIEKIPPASSSETKVTSVPPNVSAKPKDSLRKIEKIPPASSSETKVTTVPPNVSAKPKDSLRKIEKIPPASSSETKATTVPLKVSATLKDSLRKNEKIPPASSSESKVTTVPLNVSAKPKDSLRKIEKIPPASSSETKATTVPLNVSATVKDSSRKNEKILPASSSESKVTTVPLNVPAMLKATLRQIEENPTASNSESKVTMLPPKTSAMPKETDKTLNVPNSSKDTSFLSSSMMSKSMRAHNTPRKKMAPTVVSTDEDVKIKEVEILHFAIPVGNANKKTTRPKPFSFELRTKELQNKKVKLKIQQEEAEKMKRKTFHATAAPSSNVVKKTISALKPKENNVNNANPTSRTLTLKERNDLALKKKKELMDEMYEKEKKARVFHAKPAPTFKPVFVRGNSTENLRAGEKNKAKTRGISPAARQRGQSQESLVSGNQENKAPTVPNPGCPKLKNPLITENQKLKRTTK